MFSPSSGEHEAIHEELWMTYPTYQRTPVSATSSLVGIDPTMTLRVPIHCTFASL
jgi:hypothetical protein